MAEHWFRWHHGAVNDPKFRVIAARACHAMSRNVTRGHDSGNDVSVCHVVAVWAAMLECASQADERGSLTDWDDEDAAAGLGMSIDQVAAIREAMEGKVIDDGFVSAWSKRQPKREDGRVADRKREQRSREKSHASVAGVRDDGPCHAVSRNVTTEERRGEESLLSSYEERSTTGVDRPPGEAAESGAVALSGDPAGGGVSATPCPHQAIIALYHETLPELRRVRVWNTTRQGMLAKRWREDPERQALDWWRDLFGYVRQSNWLMGREQGRDGRPFDCDLEWIISPKNLAKILEGKYESRGAVR